MSNQFSSPPCFAHECEIDEVTRQDVSRWRIAERKRLIKLRNDLSLAQRKKELQRITTQLSDLVSSSNITTISVYWPILGEPDLRAWMPGQFAEGIENALPVITHKNSPLVFKPWKPNGPMVRGLWNIPTPDTDREVIPDIILVPLLGIDQESYRLGNGGGYFDRTLAQKSYAEKSIGIGFSAAYIPTIFPLPHDIPMDRIITG